jgi:hypothetical protein
MELSFDAECKDWISEIESGRINLHTTLEPEIGNENYIVCSEHKECYKVMLTVVRAFVS